MISKKKTLLVAVSFLILLSLIVFSAQPEAMSQTYEYLSQERPVNEVQELEGDQFEALLEAADNYLRNVYQEVISPGEVYEKALLYPDEDYYIVDVRGADDFVEASIISSVNIPYDTIAEKYQIDKLPRDKKIIVVCATGHTASQAAAFWGLLGFDTVAMESGMLGWQASLNCDDIANFRLSTEPREASQSFDLPELNYPFNTLEELIIAQGQNIVEHGKSPVMRHDHALRIAILGDDDYFLVDLRDTELYEKGNIRNSINIPFKTISNSENLIKLPTDKQIILISSDGYEASQAARILNILGYDALALRFGMSIWTDDIELIGKESVLCKDFVAYPTIEVQIEVPEAGPG